MTDFHCRICDVIHELPKDAVEFGKGHRGPYRKFRFRFNNMVVHDMRTGKDGRNSKTPPQPGLAQHTRWHTKRGYKKQDCKFCYLESVPEPQIPEASNPPTPEPMMVGNGSSDLRRIAEEIDQVEQHELLRNTLSEMLIEDKKVVESGNIMLAAFKKSKMEK